MNTNTHHSMEELFAQLGLPHEPADIRAFVTAHRPIDVNTRLADAPIWTPSQAAFLRETLRVDDNWSPVIDELSATLREHPDVADLPQADACSDA